MLHIIKLPINLFTILWIATLIVAVGSCSKVVAQGEYPKSSDFTISAQAPGKLFFVGEPVELMVSMIPPVDGSGWSYSVEVSSGPDSRFVIKKTVVTDQALSAGNGFKDKITVPIETPGYYDAVWTVKQGDVVRLTKKSSFAIIPHNPQDKQRFDSPFGINVHLWSPREAGAVVRRSGIAWIRDHMGGGYDPKKKEWVEEDPHLLWAEENKLCLLPVSEYYKPETGVKQGDWFVYPRAAEEVEAYARKYKGRVNYFEVYNEPYGFFWGPYFDPGGILWQGGKWVKPFYDFAIDQTNALHRGNSKIKVIWPEMDILVHANLYRDCGAQSSQMQVIAPHAYNVHSDYPEDQFWSTNMPDVLTHLKKHNMTTEIWTTEYGYSTFTKATPDQQATYKPNTEQQQANKLVRTIIMQLAGGIKKTFWYDMLCDGDDPHNPEHNFGLIRFGTFEPKPGIVAYANLIHQLEGKKLVGKVATGGYAFAYDTPKGGNMVLAVWSRDVDKHEEWMVNTKKTSVQVSNIYGQSWSQPIKNGVFAITLTESPVFITGFKPSDLRFCTQ